MNFSNHIPSSSSKPPSSDLSNTPSPTPPFSSSVSILFLVFQFIKRLSLIVVLFLILSPLFGLFLSCSFASLIEALYHPLFWPALKLSAWTSLVSLGCLVLITTPLAWKLAYTSSPFWARIGRFVIDLPLILPPAVVGVGLLTLWGSQGVLGSVMRGWGIQLPFSTLAVILAQCIVSAPFYLQSAITTFQSIHPLHFESAASLGASPFQILYRVVLPVSWLGLLNGCALAWGRSLGEFGATLVFAGNLKGVSQTLPLAIYTALESDLGLAVALSVWLMGLGASVILIFRWNLKSVSSHS